MNEIYGYKAFNKDLTNRYNEKFEIGKSYSKEGEISFGNNGNGYHMCIHLCDVFRYYNEEESVIARVIGSGKYAQRDNPNIGFYDMYSVEKIYIDSLLTREEISSIIMESSYPDIFKYVMYLKLNLKELKYLLIKYKGDYSMLSHIIYYQLDQTIYENNEKSLKIKKLYTEITNR